MVLILGAVHQQLQAESNFLVSWTLTGLVIDLVLDLTESVYDNLVTAS